MNRRTWLTGLTLAPVATLLSRESPARPAPAATKSSLPNVLLTTHENRRVRFYDDLVRGNRIVVINFMYAQCADICPGTTANLVRVQQVLGERVGREVFMYSITLEPKKDSPAVLAHYAKQFGVRPGWTFLTGNPADIELLRRALGFVDRDPEIDRDKTQHIGLIRVGNDALGRWAACAALGKPEQVAREILWIGTARAG